MAKIRDFIRTVQASGPHPTEVDCGYQTVVAGDTTYLQLSTYGSDARQSQPKVSQTLQLDRAHAVELMAIIRAAFPGV